MTVFLRSSSGSRRLTLAIAVLAALLLIGCSGGGGYKEYYPVKDGMTQRYTVTIAPMVPGMPELSLTQRVDGKETINGKEYWKIVSIMEGTPNAEPDIEYTRIDDKGIWRLDDGDPNGTESLEVPFDLTEGRQWTMSNSEGDSQYTFNGIQEVVLPDKTYKDCLAISSTGTQNGEFLEGNMYLCKNVGMVKGTATMGEIQMEFLLAESSD